MSSTRIAAALVTGLATVASTGLMAAGPSQAATTIPTKGSGVALVVRGNQGMGELVRFGADGRQQKLAHLGANWSVEDVSPDGRRVLLSDPTSNPVKFALHDTATRKTTPVKGNWSRVRFTKPSGTALIAQVAPGGKGNFPAYRTDLSGRVKVRFAEVNDELVQNPSGTLAVSGLGNRVLVNSNATGKVVRRINAPKGYGSCTAQHFRDSSTFTVSCAPTTGNRNVMQVFRVSTSGGQMVPLTSSLPRTGIATFGYIDSWTTPKGQVVRLGVGCGPQPTGLAKGRTVRIVDAGSPIRVQGSSVTIARSTGCGDGALSLVNRNLATGKVTGLAGAVHAKGESLRSFALVDPMA